MLLSTTEALFVIDSSARHDMPFIVANLTVLTIINGFGAGQTIVTLMFYSNVAAWIFTSLRVPEDHRPLTGVNQTERNLHASHFSTKEFAQNVVV